MDYQLARSLKDAGFPQGEAPRGGDIIPTGSFGYVRVPHLEELIDACGSNLYSLESNCKDQKIYSWRATARWVTKSWDGSTPTEAVARLWLALNKKE